MSATTNPADDPLDDRLDQLYELHEHFQTIANSDAEYATYAENALETLREPDTMSECSLVVNDFDAKAGVLPQLLFDGRDGLRDLLADAGHVLHRRLSLLEAVQRTRLPEHLVQCPYCQKVYRPHPGFADHRDKCDLSPLNRPHITGTATAVLGSRLDLQEVDF